MTATSAIGMSPTAANHSLERELEIIAQRWTIPCATGGSLPFTEPVPEPV